MKVTEFFWNVGKYLPNYTAL